MRDFNKGDTVDVIQMYVNSETGVVVEDCSFFNATFSNWAIWSGHGLRQVARVTTSSGDTVYCPKDGMRKAENFASMINDTLPTDYKEYVESIMERIDEGDGLDLQGADKHPLYPVFMDAIHQAMHGKGKRHGGCATPFMEQPWVHYAKMHGKGFLTGQAAKKLEEAASTKTGTDYLREMLGAMVYLGMAIKWHQITTEQNDETNRQPDSN